MAYSRPLNEPEQSPSAQFVNKKSLEEQFLLCTICFEMFDQNMHSPKLLPCNHTFCLSCLISVDNHSSRLGRPYRTFGTHYLACPTCRKMHSLGPQGTNQLPTDHKIIQMMNFLSITGKRPTKTCQQHQDRALNFFCKECEVSVCKDCMEVSHKESNGHKVIEISEDFKEFTPQFLTTRDRTAEISKKLQERINLLEDAKEKLYINKKIEEKRIKNVFATIETALYQRQGELVSSFREQTKVTFDEMTSRASQTDDDIFTISELHKQFEDARKRQDVRQLFLINRKMKEWEMSSADKANCKDDDLLRSSFTPHNAESVLESMQHIGNMQQLPDLLSHDFGAEGTQYGPETYEDYDTDGLYTTSGEYFYPENCDSERDDDW